MSLVLFNTLTGRKEPLVPVRDDRVMMYVCGPTVYDNSHIGHARAVVVFDVLFRHLRALGYDVIYVRNFTDVDDKIIIRANEQSIDFLELSDRFIRSFHEDMDALGVLRPTHEPRATEHITEMIADIESLIEAGFAYPVGGDVYFNVARYSEYGRLSGRNIDDMRAGARVEVDDRKHNPLDFALWKESKPGEPYWASPWGNGRPGWHIECSAMSNKYLGVEFDIHGGGHDLVFPHHENEIAQSAGLGRKFARVWMHNGFVRVDNQKMSKSLKNFFTIKEILAEFEPEVVRLFLLSKHYRSPIDFSKEALQETRRSLDRAYRSLQSVNELGMKVGQNGRGAATEETRRRFREAMDDDLNTAKALGYVFEAVREINRLLDEARNGTADSEQIKSWASAVLEMGGTLGILENDPSAWGRSIGVPVGNDGDEQTGDDGLTADRIEEMIRNRTEARTNKNWAEADRIRDELKALGVILEDAGGQTRWRMES